MAARRRGPAPVGPGFGSAALRGALLIGVAVILGAALLLKSFDTGGPLSTGKPGATPTTRSSAASPTSSTAPVAHNPAEVKVLVLNGVDPKKTIEKPASEALNAANYTTLTGSEAKATVTASAVYFLPGYEADAQAIATKLGMPATSVKALPTPLPEAIADPKDAMVVAVVGPDSTYGSATAAN